MPDVFTKAKRSFVMSRIRSRGNKKTELALMKVLRERRIVGWRRHVEIRSQGRGGQGEKGKVKSEKGDRAAVAEGELMVREEAVEYGTKGSVRQSEKGKVKSEKVAAFKVRPDFVFRELRVAVFVDGCFWHGCPKCYIRPGQNRKFWDAKYAGNRERDRKVNRALKAAGWRVLRIWEHEMARRGRGALVRKLERVLRAGEG